MINSIIDFFKEIEVGNLEQVECFIKNGIDVNQKDENGQTALMVAVMNNKPEVVRLLLENNADVNAYGNEQNKRNALNFASAFGLIEIVSILLDYKPNMKLLNIFGGTPLIPACEKGQYEAAKILLERTDVDINHINHLGFTAIYEVAFSKAHTDPIYEEIAKLLIKHGADVNITDKEGRTPLTIARENELSTLATILEQNGGK